MKDGDIYFWRWKDSISRPYAYHCYSQKAVVVKGTLRDTYWHDYEMSGERILPLDKVDLTYMGNRDEMTAIQRHEAAYYKPDDVVDMAHANASRAPVYIKPGAERDPATMMAFLEYKIEREESSIRSATNSIERLRKDIQAVQEGRLNEVYA